MRSIRTLDLPALAVGLSILGACGRDVDAREPPSPVARHSIVVVVDTLRADALGCYGARDGRGASPTPVVDSLAARGALFAAVTATSTFTPPATVSMLSGLGPLEHGLTARLRRRIPDDVPLLAEELARAGFATGAVICNPLLGESMGFDRGFDAFHHLPRATAREAVDVALDWLRHREPDEERIHLYLHLFDPHWPYEPAEEERLAYALPPSPIDEAQQLQLGAEMMRGSATALVALIDWCRWASKAYAACVASVDRELGRFVEGAVELGLGDDTLLVFTSDHGEEFGEHGAVGHARQLFSETLHVPLIVTTVEGESIERAPIRARVSARHVARTVAARAEVAAPALSGVDLLDARARRRAARSSEVLALELALWFEASDVERANPRTVRNLLGLERGGQRLLWTFDGSFEEGAGALVELREGCRDGSLVGLGADDVASGSAAEDLLDELRGRWVSSRKLAIETVDPARREQLRALGYFDAEPSAPR